MTTAALDGSVVSTAIPFEPGSARPAAAAASGVTPPALRRQTSSLRPLPVGRGGIGEEQLSALLGEPQRTLGPVEALCDHLHSLRLEGGRPVAVDL